jgi:hypothetical protein
MGRYYFGPDWTYEYMNVDLWLTEATQGFCDIEVRRIREEILEHYEQIIWDLEQRGILGLEAQRAAIEQLGTPKAAHKRFRATHLLKYEEKYILRLKKRMPRLRLMIAILFFVGLTIFNVRLPNDYYFFACIVYITMEYVGTDFISHFSLRHGILSGKFSTELIFFSSLLFLTGYWWVAAISTAVFSGLDWRWRKKMILMSDRYDDSDVDLRNP